MYSTTLQFAERSGLGLRIVDENVGTGDNAETDFDLDHSNVISSSYTLQHAASGSNSMTALTETTHYTLDKESGRILLESAGVTALGTDILYATYWHTDQFSDTVISDLIDIADDEIDLRSGRKWDTATEVTEYYSGERTSMYPTTDAPYAPDWDRPDQILLRHSPVVNVSEVYFVTQTTSFNKVFNWDQSTFTAITDEANSTVEGTFSIWQTTPSSGDIMYIGMASRFLGLRTVLATLGVGSPSLTWEYYNGTTWASLNTTEVDSGSSDFTASGLFRWSFPYGWTQTSVNSESLYWIRVTFGGTYSTPPVMSVMAAKDMIYEVVELNELDFRSSGIMYVLNRSVMNGRNNIRVTYSYGQTTTPSYITELSVLIAAIKAFISTSGGSYDDATHYRLGSKEVIIGEQYVNIREVLSQYRKRMDEIFDMIGRKINVEFI